ncbi:MAG TPA: transglycosylase domain-containing protein [Solirubrobacteraceae bacterium]|nr:transglycosylase domain-containing protein [Solirubrobacteraceae bacterium]
MSVENYTQTADDTPPGTIVPAPERRHRRLPHRPRRPARPRVRKRRLLVVLSAFGLLAVISTLFGALTSIASDLPKLENTVQFSHNVDSYLYDVTGAPIGPLAPASTPAIDNWNQISQNMVHSIVAVEDRGFWGESGISVRGLLRAGLADLTGRAIQGGSTIPEEFIKNVRQEESHRTIAEKLVEAAMAFQLSHHWSHEKILTEYLNTIYFGNGAIGIEAAARVYFGWNHGYDPSNPAQGGRNACGDADPLHPNRPECASVLTPAEAALLAAMVANPSAFNPAGTAAERDAALARRNDVVLRDMYAQHYLSYRQYQTALHTPLPTSAEIRQPQQQPSAAPYFTSWVGPQIVSALEHEGLSPKTAQYEAYYGGLKIRLSIDLNMQRQAQAAVDNELFTSPGLPSASLVAIDNRTGEVRAMVSGNGDYQTSPFNLATMGYRQPGSAFKIFTLAAALSRGVITPYSLVDSRPITIHFVHQHGNAYAAANGTGRFPVHNFANDYAGAIPMTVATAVSDNSVFSQVGTDPRVGTARIANYAHLMGIRSPISTSPAMILGGLHYGVSALDMAHAYATAANGGVKLFNPTLGDGDGPIGIASISGCKPCHRHNIANTPRDGLVANRVLTPQVDAMITELLHGPVEDSYGTGTQAAIPGVSIDGKTGTTTNEVDAWFVGWTPQITTAVWVGYPNSGQPMLTQYYGKPVEGGTFPALIWHNFMVSALQILQAEAQHRSAAASTITAPASTYAGATSATAPTASTTSTSASATSTSPTPTTANPAGVTPAGASSAAPSVPSQTETLPQTGATTPSPAPATTPATTPPPTSTTGSGGSGL